MGTSDLALFMDPDQDIRIVEARGDHDRTYWKSSYNNEYLRCSPLWFATAHVVLLSQKEKITCNLNPSIDSNAVDPEGDYSGVDASGTNVRMCASE